MREYTIKFKESEIEYRIECLPEEMPVRGNLTDSGDAELDKRDEDAVIAEIENGNDWAWCTIRVVATYKGLEGNDYLGGCTYSNENDFIAGGYFDDMKDQARSDLLSKLGIEDQNESN